MARYGIDVPEEWTSPKILQWARTEIGLTEHEAANLIDADPATIQSWERGTFAPSFDELRKLSEVYDCPLGYFFLEAPPATAQISLDYRGLDETKTDRLRYETRRQLRQFVRLVDYAQTLITALEIDWAVRVPEVAPYSAPDEAAADAVAALGLTPDARAAWPSAEDAFNGWRAAMEESRGTGLLPEARRWRLARCVVMGYGPSPGNLGQPRGCRGGDGADLSRCYTNMRTYCSGRAGVVCDFRGSGQQQRIETFANKFAASALVPRKAFEERLSRLGLNHARSAWGDSILNTIREPFHASRDTILILLEEMGFAEEGTYRRKRASWDKRRPYGYGKSRPGLTKARRRYRELGRNFSRLLRLADRSDAVSRSELASLVDMKVERVEEFFDLVA